MSKFLVIVDVLRYDLNCEDCVNDLFPVDHVERWCRSERTADAFALRAGKQALAGRVPVATEWDGPWHEGDTTRDTLVLRRKRDGRLLGEVRVLYGKGWDR